jgi:hypothetical protein
LSALLRANDATRGKRNIFTPYSTRQIMIWGSIHRMLPCGAPHLLQMAAPRAATALPKEFAEVTIQYTPFLKNGSKYLHIFGIMFFLI